MNYQDGYSQKALDALSKGKYANMRSNDLAHSRYDSPLRQAKQEAKKNRKPPTVNGMKGDPRYKKQKVKEPTLDPGISLMQTDFGILPVPNEVVMPETDLSSVIQQANFSLPEFTSQKKEVPSLISAYRWKEQPSLMNDNLQALHDDIQKPSTRYTNETEKDFLNGKIKDYADNHSIISTLNSISLAPGVALEGIESALGGLFGQDAYDQITGKKFAPRGVELDPLAATKAKEGIRQGVQDNIDSGAGKFAYNTTTGLADMGINMAMSGGNPVALGVVSGAQNAAQNTLHAIERGLDEDKARKTGLATGVVAGIMNSVGLDSVLKSTAKTVLGQVLQGAGKEGLENVVEDVTDTFIDKLINGKDSELDRTLEHYKQSGLSDEEAVKSTFNDYLKQEATSFASGAVFGGLIGGGKKAIPSLLSQKPDSSTLSDVSNPVEPTRVPDVVENARAQAERAQAEVERLNQQLPEEQAELDNPYNFGQQEAPVNEVAASDTGIESNPRITERSPFPEKADGSRPDYHNVEEVGTRLETTRQSIAKNNEDIEVLNKQLNDIPDLKKNAKERSALQNQIYQLEQQNKQSAKLEKILTKISDGEKVSNKDIFEVEFPDDYHAIFDGRGGFFGRVNMATKFAGDTPEAKALAQSIRDDIYAIAKGDFDVENLGGLLEKVYNLDRMAKETKADYRATGRGKNQSRLYKYDDFFAGTKNGIGDDFTSYVIHSLDKAYQIANNMTDIDTTSRVVEAAGESAPITLLDGVAYGETINIDGADYTVDKANNNLIDADGKSVPIVDPAVFDTSQRGTETQTKRQFAANLIKYIKDNYIGKTFVVKDNGHKIGFIGDSAKEFAGSRSAITKNNEKMGIKANIAPRLQSVIENAIFSHHESNTKTNVPIKARGIDKYNVTVAYPTKGGIKLYDAVMDIGLHRDGNEYFYDILNIEPKKKVDPQLASNDVDTDFDRPSFDNKVPQNAQNVNNRVPTVSEVTNDTGIDNRVPTVTEGNVPPENGGDKVRSFSKRGSMDETLPEEVRNSLSEDMYKVVRNAETSARAEELFDPADLTQTRSNLKQAIDSHDPASALLSYKLAKAYVDEGNYDAATDVIEDVSAELTRMGQFTQAAKLAMMQNDPMAAIRAYQRDLNKLNQWGKKKYKKKWNDLKLTQEDIDLFNGVQKGDKDGLNNVVDQLNRKFGKQIPSTWWDKTVSASKTAMLLNPRTQSRNILANMAMLPVRSMSDRVSALGQGAAYLFDKAFTHKGFERTQSLTGGTHEQKTIARQIWDQLKDDITGDNKMKDSVKSDILSQRQTFNNDFFAKWINNLTDGGVERLNERLGASGNTSTMETLQNFTYWLMGDFGDTPFVKKNFVNRLASYMKAQGIDNIDDVPDDAIAIATQEALKATFKDDNVFTKALQGAKKYSGKFGEVALPFVKTPANLTMRAIDYSPAGLVNTFRKIKSGAQANEVIDELAKNLTGTAMIYLGYKLAEKGIISGQYSSDRDEASFQKQQGQLEYALHIGDNYYTYDWMQPAATPLVIGTTIYEAVKNSDDENASVGDIINATYKGGLNVANTLINSSPLQSLSDLLGADGTDEGGVAKNIANEIIEFPQRLIPSFLGATARTVDPVMRDTYISDDTFTGMMGNQARSAMAKVPFLSKTLPASYDTWGNERTRSDSVGESFVAQMVNPGQLGNKNETPLDSEIQRLYDATGNAAVFPMNAARKLDLGSDGNITLTNKQHSEYQKLMGQTSYKYVESLMNNEDFQALSDDEKVATLEKAYKLSNDLAKEELFDHTTDNNKNLKELARTGSPDEVAKYLLDSAKASSLGMNVDTYQKKEAELPNGAVQYAKNRDAAKEVNMTADNWNKVREYAGQNADKVVSAIPKLQGMGLNKQSAYYAYANAVAQNPNLSVPEFTNTFKVIDTDGSQKIKQSEMFDYFKKNNMSEAQAITSWKTYYGGKKVPYLKSDGSWGAK